MFEWKIVQEFSAGERRWLKQERFQEAGKKDYDFKWEQCSDVYVTTT